MTFKLKVSNLSFNTTGNSLRSAFMEYGQVIDAMIIKDRDTGRSRGFGFVSFDSSEDAENAVKADDSEIDGHRIKVAFAAVANSLH